MLLLSRRRAGQISDERLHLAAYLGDPVARALWEQSRPGPARLEAVLAPRFLVGVAEDVAQLWSGLLDDEGLPAEIRALIDAAAAAPRLRRLAPALEPDALGFLNATAYPSTLGLWIRVDQSENGSASYLIEQRGDPRPAIREVEPIAAVDRAAALLPEQPRPVWRGSGKSYPQARFELGDYNDELSLEAWINGLRAAREEHLTHRIVLALAEELDRRWRQTFPGCDLVERALAAIAAYLLDPNPLHTQAAIRAISAVRRSASPSRLRESGGRIVVRLDDLRPRASVFFDILAFFDHATIRERIGEQLIPWALGDPDPLTRFVHPAE